MGGVLTGKLKPILSQYTYNFDQKQISIKMIRGLFQIDNLILNDKEINKKLQELKLPFKLKFGVLKKFKLKLSLMGGRLENLDVDSLIVVLGPNEELLNKKFQGEEEDILIKTCLNNMRKNSQKNYLSSEILFNEDQKQYETFIKNQQIKKQKEIKQKQKLKDEDSQSKVNIMSVEIFEIIKNFLDTDIKFENIYIVYENNLDFIDNTEKLNLKKFNLTLNLRQFYFKFDDLSKHVNNQGIFKNFINVASFLKKSGTWSQSKNAYWEMDIESFQISFATGNPFFFNEDHYLQNQTEGNIEYVLEQFYEKFERNKIQNSFDLFQMNKTTLDIIIFYKDTSKIPINAIFINLDLSKINFNLEIQKMELFLDILAYFNNASLMRQIETLSPKFKILSKKKLKQFELKNKLTAEDQQNLKLLRKNILKEYFYLSIYANMYTELLSKNIQPQIAKVIIFKKFTQESFIYKHIFGQSCPNYIKQDQQLQDIQQNIKFEKKNKKKDIQQILKEINTKVKTDKNILILKKIHIHFRINCNIKLNILNKVSDRIDNALDLRGFIIDFLNPVGTNRIKFLLQINDFQLNASQNQFPDIRKQKLGIFKSNMVTSKYSSIHQNSGFIIIQLQNFYFQFDISLTPGKQDNIVIMVYSDNVLGSFEYNYYPQIFKKLVETLVDLLNITKKNFRIKLTNQKVQYNKWRNMEEIRKAREIVQRLKLNTFKKITNQQKRNNMIIKHQQKNVSSKLQQLESEKNLENQLRSVNQLLQNIVINFQVQTQPFIIRIYDQSFKENLILKYQNQLIKLNIDLAFKEIVNISALGVEMQSKESIPALRTLIKSIQQDMQKIKEFHKKDLNFQ